MVCRALRSCRCWVPQRSLTLQRQSAGAYAATGRVATSRVASSSIIGSIETRQVGGSAHSYNASTNGLGWRKQCTIIEAVASLVKSAGASTVMSIAGLPRQTRTTIVPQPTWTPFFARRDRPPCPPCAPRFVRPLFWGMAKWVSDKGLCEDEGSAAGSALSFVHDLNPTGGWSGTCRPMPQRVKQGLCPQRRWVM